MVASLQCKKEALEAKLKDKTNELKKLCFEEAELTGILPVETPLDPGESPPHFPRRIGTSYAFPENLIDRLQSKEDKTIASLELECQIQTGIAEAALGIANDGSSSKSVRRRHKVIYQESQRKLFDLEAKLNSLKHVQNRQIKKNSSTPSEGDQDEDDKNINRNVPPNKHETLSHSLSDSWVPPRTFHSFNSLSRVSQYYPVPSGNHCNSGYNLGVNYMNCALPSIPQQYVPIQNQSPADLNWYADNERNSMVINQVYNNDTFEANLHRNRSGLVDRNEHCQPYNDNFNRMASTLPRNGCFPPTNSVLLPGQTYPDNSLMRTQSLGNVGNYSQAEKKKEKEWYETSLDSSPVQSRSHQVSGQASPVDIKTPEPMFDKSNNLKYPGSPVKTQHASINNYQFDTVVPYESPKNHTVIEAGKWQPYREVTKPFEMSDFYKYSTKFKKGKTSPGANSAQRRDSVIQQKAIYQPLQPQECQPLNNDIGKKVLSSSDLPKSFSPSPELVHAWYGEKQPNSPATLV